MRYFVAVSPSDFHCFHGHALTPAIRCASISGAAILAVPAKGLPCLFEEGDNGHFFLKTPFSSNRGENLSYANAYGELRIEQWERNQIEMGNF